MNTAQRKLKVAVLTGGISTERDVSLQSGSCVAQALKEAGHSAVPADISPDNLAILEDDSIDVFFPALHGRFGEDGELQQILDDKSLVYTGSGPTASRLAFDKMASKKVFSKTGITTPAAFQFRIDADVAEVRKELRELADKYVVKPVRQGSTIGVSILDNPELALEVAQQCLNEFGDCMVEEYIAGTEVTVGILGNEALPVIEIRTGSGFYDYHAKYNDEQTEYFFDTIDSLLKAKIQADAIACFNALGLRHFARIDFRLNNDGIPYVLEANTIPGLTAHSLLPKAAVRAGISMSRLCMRIIEAALENREKRPVVNYTHH